MYNDATRELLEDKLRDLSAEIADVISMLYPEFTDASVNVRKDGITISVMAWEKDYVDDYSGVKRKYLCDFAQRHGVWKEGVTVTEMNEHLKERGLYLEVNANGSALN